MLLAGAKSVWSFWQRLTNLITRVDTPNFSHLKACRSFVSAPGTDANHLPGHSGMLQSFKTVGAGGAITAVGEEPRVNPLLKDGHLKCTGILRMQNASTLAILRSDRALLPLLFSCFEHSLRSRPARIESCLEAIPLD